MGVSAGFEASHEQALAGNRTIADEGTRRIGSQLRAKRQQLRLTLDQVAASTGLTKGFLSDVERDRALPSLGSLLRLCRTLEIEISSLFTTKAGSSVVRAERRKLAVGFGIGITEYQMTPGNDGRMLALISEMEPAASSGDEDHSLNCEQCFALVLAGRITINVEKQEHVLETGDAMTYDPLLPHRIRNASDSAPARVLFVLTPPPR